MSYTDIMAKKLQKSMAKTINKRTLTSENMDEFLKELRVILLEADVDFRVTKTLISEIKKKAIGEFVKEGLDHSEMLKTIIYEEFSNIMGINHQPLVINQNPTAILVAGLQGTGKTTTVAKLALYIKQKLRKKCLLVACDTNRLAAIEQIKALGKNLGIDVYSEKNQSPEVIAKNGKKYAEKNGYEVVLVDTAGRLHIDENLMDELKQIEKIINPQEEILVVDGMSGQETINIVNSFIEKIKIKSFIITKMDGTARGGIALSLSYLTKLPIKFLGTGEKPSDLEAFYPKRMASRILGMGDVETLVEKIESNVSTRDLEETKERMMAGQYDLNDYLNQRKQLEKMGKIGAIAKMIPGLSAKISSTKLDEVENNFKISEYIINSTTPEERKKPTLLRYPSRKNRILKGSGRNEKELNKLLSEYERTKKMMDMVAGQLKKGEMPNFPGLDDIINNKNNKH